MCFYGCRARGGDVQDEHILPLISAANLYCIPGSAATSVGDEVCFILSDCCRIVNSRHCVPPATWTSSDLERLGSINPSLSFVRNGGCASFFCFAQRSALDG
ncbi:hypothetical protein EON65_49555 [archaeon]|nr:MAG: hypothetical protein EON65_49555 [archaeon]